MMPRNPAMRRYFRVHVALSALYIALVLVASQFIPDDAAPTPTVIAFALLPGFVVLGWIWNMGRLLALAVTGCGMGHMAASAGDLLLPAIY